MNPKINKSKLSEDQLAKLEAYQQAEDQLQALDDIAKMTQEVINILDDKKSINGLGALLTDIRESLDAINKKEAPQPPDYAKPVVDGLGKLEKAITGVLGGLDLKPNVKVDAPAVNVTSNVDLKGVEKTVSSLSKDFAKAIKQIPKPEKPDNSKLLEVWENIYDQLKDIDRGVRMKPLPGSTKISNLSDGKVGLVPFIYDEIQATYPTTASEVYAYKLASTTVATVTVTYTDATKAVLTSTVRT